MGVNIDSIASSAADTAASAGTETVGTAAYLYTGVLRQGYASFLSLAYLVLWVYPIYLLGFVLNTIWYQEIADYAYDYFIAHRPVYSARSSANSEQGVSPSSSSASSFSSSSSSASSSSSRGDTAQRSGAGSSQIPATQQQQQQKQQQQGKKEGLGEYYLSRQAKATTVSIVLSSVTEEFYRLFVVLLFVVEFSILGLVLPSWLGTPLMALHVCWLYSFYAFEYRWAAEAWPLEVRFRFFEHRAAYFCGFGFMISVITLLFPGFFSSGLFSMLLPIWIVLAISAPTEDIKPGTRVPVFFIVRWVNGQWLGLVQRWKGIGPRRTGQ